jgi:hypothetical protein
MDWVSLNRRIGNSQAKRGKVIPTTKPPGAVRENLKRSRDISALKVSFSPFAPIQLPFSSCNAKSGDRNPSIVIRIFRAVEQDGGWTAFDDLPTILERVGHRRRLPPFLVSSP